MLRKQKKVIDMIYGVNLSIVNNGESAAKLIIIYIPSDIFIKGGIKNESYFNIRCK